ncbi:MAG TPA: tetratricopeptide repeat protein [Verrucomicrobiae bacterium]|nr:tetratricopeptide repeat protein [Verrucomicrobiae bacterium]
MDRTNGRRATLIICALLAGVTLAVYWPVLRAGFIQYDDPVYVSSNPHVTSGLSWGNVRWALTTGRGQNWFPLTWISHMLDVQFFGLRPGMHHLTNLLIHAASSILLFLALYQMTRARGCSAFAAALFAVHPLHVESVAWVAERKDVLSGLFFMLTLLAYRKYTATGSDGVPDAPRISPASTRSIRDEVELVPALRRMFASPAYWLCLLSFACGLMSKPMLVTVPFVLLLLDYWPLCRLRFARQGWRLAPGSANWKSLLVEKIPFFLLTILSCLITMRAQTAAMVDPHALPLPARLQNAVLSYAHYLGQIFWPARLAIFYPYSAEFSIAAVVLAFIVLAGMTTIVVFLGRRFPFAPTGWFWFLGMLVPTIGLVQVGSQSRADRYTYLPSIGIFIVLAWGAAALAAKIFRTAATGGGSPGSAAKPPPREPLTRGVLPLSSWVLSIPAIGVIAALAITARAQTSYWRDGETVFRHAAAVTQENYVAWGGLGIVEIRRKNYDAALADLRQALAYAETHGAEGGIKYYMGVALQMAGKGPEALRWLQESKPLPEQEADRSYRIGLSLLEEGRLDEAAKALNDALSAQPDNSDFQLGLAALLQRRGDFSRAEGMLEALAAKDPKSVPVHRHLAEVLLRVGKPAEAAEHLAAALKAAPDDIHLLQLYADALDRVGQPAEALTQLHAAVKLAPKDGVLRYKLAQLYSETGQTALALPLYAQAIELAPKLPAARNDLAWVLATDPDSKNRDGARAVQLAETACEETHWNEPLFIGTLAAACAEAGQFPRAVEMAEKARTTAQSAGQTEVARRNQELLALYQQGKAYHEPPANPQSRQ